MSKVTFAFTSGKCITLDTQAESIADFFERNQNEDGLMTGWLLFADGYAVKADNVDWILVEGDEKE